MTSETTIQAWKDPVFRATLGAGELAALPANPAGVVALSDEELMETTGGSTPWCIAIAVGILVAQCTAEEVVNSQ